MMFLMISLSFQSLHPLLSYQMTPSQDLKIIFFPNKKLRKSTKNTPPEFLFWQVKICEVGGEGLFLPLFGDAEQVPGLNLVKVSVITVDGLGMWYEEPGI